MHTSADAAHVRRAGRAAAVIIISGARLTRHGGKTYLGRGSKDQIPSAADSQLLLWYANSGLK